MALLGGLCRRFCVWAVVWGPRHCSVWIWLRDQPCIPTASEPEEPGYVAWQWPMGLEGRGMMLLSRGTAMAAPSMPGLDADSSCCGSWGLFLTSSMGNCLLGSQRRVGPDVPQQDSGAVPALAGLSPRIQLPSAPLQHGGACAWPPRSTWASGRDGAVDLIWKRGSSSGCPCQVLVGGLGWAEEHP